MQKKRARFFSKGLSLLVAGCILTQLVAVAAPAPQTLGPMDTRSDARDKALVWLAAQQKADGSWGSAETALHTAEVAACLTANDFTDPQVYSKATDWLTAATPGSHDDLFRFLTVPAVQQAKTLAALTARQNADGGFSLVTGYQSDVLDTALALEAMLAVTLSEGLAAQRASSFLMTAQQPDGSWRHGQEGDSSEILTACVTAVLTRYKLAARRQNDALELALTKGRAFLMAARRIDGTWGLAVGDVSATLFACEAFRSVDAVAFDKALDALTASALADGSICASPAFTARFVRLLSGAGTPVTPVNIIKDIIITAPPTIRDNTGVRFLPVLEGFSEATMSLVGTVRCADGTLVPLTASQGAYPWNTGSYAPGGFEVVFMVFDKDKQEYIDAADKPFTVEDGFALTDAALVLSPSYVRVGSAAQVGVRLDIAARGNVSRALSVRLTVTDDAGQTVHAQTTAITIPKGTGDYRFSLGSFTPPTDREQTLELKAAILGEGVSHTAEGALPIYPPRAGNVSIKLEQQQDKYRLMPGADDTRLTFTLKAEGEDAPGTPEKAFATEDDFDAGTTVNTVIGAGGSVSLDNATRPFHFIWVANSGKGTVMKINTDTNEVIGEYYTSPQGQPRNPSRTTVDHDGNVWVANRDGNSVTKIGLVENGGWVDKNGDGICQTSAGLGDILPWTNQGGADTNGGTGTAEDECLLLYVRTSASGTRHLSINKDNNIWVSGYSSNRSVFNLIDSETGQILRTEGPPPAAYGGYGGLIDKNGVIWSSNPLLRWDTALPLSGPNGGNWRGYSHNSYGLAIDSLGHVWNSSNGAGMIYKFAPDGTLVGTYNQGNGAAQGCAVGLDDDVWVAHSMNSLTVGHLKNDGTFVGNVSVPGGPIGVAIDDKGFVWATCNDGRVRKIDPTKGAVGADGVTPVGQVIWTSANFGGVLYNYSDMTGSTLSAPPKRGTWTGVYDSGQAGAEWGFLNWTGEVSGNGSLVFFASSSADGVTFTSPVEVQKEDSGGFDVPPGRYIKIDVRFVRAETGESPVLKTLTVRGKTVLGTDARVVFTVPDADAPAVTTAPALTPAPGSGGQVFTWTIPKLSAGRSYKLTIDEAFAGLVPDSTVLLAKNVALTYNDANGDFITENGQNQQAVVNPSRVFCEVKTDKSAYMRGETVSITYEAESFIDPQRPLRAELEIVDRVDSRVALLSDSLGFTDTLDGTRPWNSAAGTLGEHAAVLRVYDEANILCGESIARFTIREDGGFTSGVSTDKKVYTVGDTVIIRDRVAHSFATYRPRQVEVSLTVKNSAGQPYFAAQIAVGAMNDPAKDVERSWSLPGYVPSGEYTVTSRVFDNAAEVCSSTCTIQINKPMHADLPGQVRVTNKSVTLGQPVPMVYELENKLGQDIDEARLTLTFVHRATLATLFTYKPSHPVMAGGLLQMAYNLPTGTAWPTGEYLVYYAATVGADTYALTGDTFTLNSSGGDHGTGGGEEIVPNKPVPTAGPIPYRIECYDKATGKLFYFTDNVWEGEGDLYVYSPKHNNWTLSSGQKDYQILERKNPKKVYKFNYDADVSGTHEAYLKGYPDKTFRPDGDITRSEAAALMYRIIIDDTKETLAASSTGRFSDTTGHWAEKEIGYLTLLQMINGYPDGTYKPNSPITREEFFKLLVIYANLQPKLLKDSGASGWSKEYVDNAISNEYVIGFADGSLGLKRHISRAQVVTIVNRILNRTLEPGSAQSSFTDLEKTHWAYNDIVEGAVSHKYERTGGKEIPPPKAKGRADSSATVAVGALTGANSGGAGGTMALAAQAAVLAPSFAGASAQGFTPAADPSLPTFITDDLGALSLVQTYQWVRNTIVPEFHADVRRTAELVYGTKLGNDVETASLLIALMRHKGLRARYVQGVARLTAQQAMAMTGTNTTAAAEAKFTSAGASFQTVKQGSYVVAFLLARTWAEVELPYDNYRGAGPGAGALSWIPLDAGFKTAATLPENANYLPCALPYEVSQRIRQFDHLDTIPQEGPTIDTDIPSAVLVGTSPRFTVVATAPAGISALTVTQDNRPVTLDGAGSFVFDASVAGDYVFVIKATDRNGSTATLTRTVKVSEATDTERPELKATVDPGDHPAVGVPVAIHVEATDNSGTVHVTVTVNNGPPLAGSSPYTFTPDREDVYVIRVHAEDPSGNWSEKQFTLTYSGGGGPSDTIPPEVKAQAPATVYVGEPFDITYTASDNSGTVTVTVKAGGAVVPSSGGRATYTPTAPGPLSIVVEAEDPSGNKAGVKADINAVERPAGAVGLQLVVNGGQPQSNINEPVHAQVTGIGLDPAKPLSLTVNGVGLTLDGSGRADYTPAQTGVYTFEAAGVDKQGKTHTETFVLYVGDPTNTGGVTAEITSPADGAEITEPVEVKGSAGGAGLAYYTLSIAPVDGGVYEIIAQGGAAVTNGVLGRFDPTLLENGFYHLRLTAYGSTSAKVSEITVSVTGDMKLGHFSLNYQDMVLPVRQLPLAVNRGYDSRRRAQSGDFGYGWELLLSGAKVSVSGPMGEGWAQGTRSGPFGIPIYHWVDLSKHTVKIDWGNGVVSTFDMKLSPAESQLLPMKYGISATFTPRTGTTGKLTASGGESLMWLGDQLIDDSSFAPFDPDRFRLTAADGTVYELSLQNGVESVTTPLGDKITVTSGGITHSNGEKFNFIRDGKGRITSVTGPDNRKVSYVYDGRGDLVEVTDLTGGVTKFVYDKKHFLIDVIDPRGIRATRNEYDDEGRLTAIIDANGNRMAFDNDLDGRRKVVADRLGNPTVYLYDDKGHVLSETDALGRKTTFTYDAAGYVKTKTDALGHESVFEHDAAGHITSARNALGVTAGKTYNSAGQVLSISMDGQPHLVMTYLQNGLTDTIKDAAGNVTQMHYDAGGQLTSITDSLGTVAGTVRDSRGNVTAMTDGKGHRIEYTYDTFGNVLTKTETMSTEQGPKAVTETYSYNNAGQLTGSVGSDGSSRSLTYNAIGKMETMTGPDGKIIRIDYDELGEVKRVIFPDGTEESFVRDAESRVTAATNRTGATTAYEYDAAGQLTKKTQTGGGVTKYTYDKTGRLETLTNPAGGVTRYEYDDAGRNTAVVDALGGRTVYAYTSVGYLESRTDALGHVTRYEYDKNGNRTKVILPGGHTMTSEYDARDRRIKDTDANGHVTSYRYDANNRLIGLTDAENGQWQYGYDETGNLNQITNPLNQTTGHVYDARGRRVRTTDARGGVTTMTYNGKGQLVQEQSAAGDVSYQYDDKGRLQRREAGTIQETYTYGANGRLMTVTDGNGSTGYTYDTDGRLLSMTSPGGQTVTYEYNASGLTAAIVTAFGRTEYTYDKLDRLSAVTAPEGKTEYTYDAVGNRSSMTQPNGVKTEYAFDDANRLTSVTLTKGVATLASYRYTLGGMGERLKVEEEGRTLTYTYDKLYRLTGEKAVGALPCDITYTYDAAGNRKTKTSGGVTTPFEYDAMGALLREGTVTYVVNAAGQRTKMTEGTAVTEYQYDGLGRLSRVSAQDGAATRSETYQYDYAGRRLSKTDAAGTTRFLYDVSGGLPVVVAEMTSTGDLKARYTYGHELLSQLRGATVSHYGFDGHGDTRLLTNTSGAVTDTYTYDAFGETVARTGTTENDFLYCGEQRDTLSGLYFLRARYMDPSSGVFLTPDSYEGDLKNPLSLHKYLYAHASPVNFDDPSGQFIGGMMSMSLSLSGLISLECSYYKMMFRGINIVATQALANIFSEYTFDTEGAVKDFISDLVISVDILKGLLEDIVTDMLKEELFEMLSEGMVKTLLQTADTMVGIFSDLLEVWEEFSSAWPKLKFIMIMYQLGSPGKLALQGIMGLAKGDPQAIQELAFLADQGLWGAVETMRDALVDFRAAMASDKNVSHNP